MSNTFPEAFELQSLLVRLDPIEAWAEKIYALETVPGWNVFLRQALLGMLRDGRVIYVETLRVGLRLFQAKKWAGMLADLGKPEPPSAGFVAAKAIRVHAPDVVRESSFVVSIDGRRKIVSFTGIHASSDLPGKWHIAQTGVNNIPQVGIITQWAASGVLRLRNRDAASRSVEAANAWRAVLDGRTDLRDLPLLFASSRQPVGSS